MKIKVLSGTKVVTAWYVHTGRLYRCVRCPTAYHVGDFCIAAGSVHLGGYHILCSSHFQPVKNHKHHLRINVSWCFSCSKGELVVNCGKLGVKRFFSLKDRFAFKTLSTMEQRFFSFSFFHLVQNCNVSGKIRGKE